MNKFIRALSVASTMGLLLGSLVVPIHTLGATDTGGYPWADALLVRAATYDWGYRSCQPAMRTAGTCPGHTTTKLGLRYYQSDPWRYDVRNCTSYVAWRIKQEYAVDIPGWGNAKDWDTAALRAGFRVDTTPAVGAIAQWESYYGHVAYITAVNPDSSVNVEQYNKAGTGEFSRQSRVKANHYIHIHDKQEADQSLSTTNISVSIPQSVSSEPAVQPKIPVPALAPLSPVSNMVFPDKEGVSYLPALSPVTNEVNVFAVEYQTTNSDKIEISKTSTKDGNTAWEQHWVTNQPVMSEVSLKFLVADANADGQLDLYIIRTSGTASRKHEVIVLDGANEYRSTIGSWQTSQDSTVVAQDYSLADYDGNGSLDLYTLVPDANQLDIKILDGSSQFAAPLAEWHAPLTTPDNVKPRFVVADHDRDGRADVYAVGQEVTVLSAASNYQKPIEVWKRQQD